MIDSFFDEYRFLSNFYKCEIEWEGRTYPSVEHAYQASKTTNEEDKERISRCVTSGQAKKIGREVEVRKNWELFKVEYMRSLVFKKFLFHADLAEKLMATYPHELVEGNTWGDTYWGVCDGKGKNILGHILMEVRLYLLTQKRVFGIVKSGE